MAEERLVPELRFPKFEGEWCLNSLGDFANITKLAGFEYTKHVVYSNAGFVIGLRAINIKENRLNLSDVQYIDKSDFSKLDRSRLYIGDMLFTYVGANIGDVAMIDENDRYYLAPNISRIRINTERAIGQFVFQYFTRRKFRQKEVSRYIASSSQPALSMESIRKFKRVYDKMQVSMSFQ